MRTQPLPRGNAPASWLLAASAWSIAAGVAAAPLPEAAPAEVGLSAERLAVLDAAMQARIDERDKAGIVVLVAKDGKVAHHKAFGMADVETREPMRRDSIVRLHTMTKPITSVALLTLYEQGKFQLSDPLDRYIPAMANLRVFTGVDAAGNITTEPPRRKPTIHDVFRHTGGFSYGTGNVTRRSRLSAARHRQRARRVVARDDRREAAAGAAAVSPRRAMGLQRVARHPGVPRRAFLRHAVRRVSGEDDLRPARDGRHVLRSVARARARQTVGLRARRQRCAAAYRGSARVAARRATRTRMRGSPTRHLAAPGCRQRRWTMRGSRRCSSTAESSTACGSSGARPSSSWRATICRLRSDSSAGAMPETVTGSA